MKTQEVYEPSEDSYLLEYYVSKLANGIVLDIGTGSGIQAKTASTRNEVEKVYAVDINSEAIKYCKRNIKDKKIKFLKSDLFKAFKNRKKLFDTIIFNAPYLPAENKKLHLATEGGRKGWELIQKFLENTTQYLAPKGVIFLVFSSLTNKHKVDRLIEENLFDSLELGSKRVFFETIYVYLLNKKEVVPVLQKKGFREITYFTHGKRGVILTAKYNEKKVAIKVEKPDSEAEGKIENEANILKIVNKKGIGPKIVLTGKEFVAYEFIEGKIFQDWVQKANKKEIIEVFKSVFEQCYELDKLGLTKEEMHHPWKNIIIGKKPVLIDFERTRKTQDAQNVAQFVQCTYNLQSLLKKAGFKLSGAKLIELAKNYQDDRNEANFGKIIDVLR